MGWPIDAWLMAIKSLEKLSKRTLRERIYEEVVRLIFSGELPRGGWVDEKQVIDRLRVSRTPFREAIGILAKGGLIEIKPYRGFYVRSFSRDETADLYELYKRLECFAVELAVPQMSDCDIRRFENILLEAMVALQRGDMKTYAMREREFYETIRACCPWMRRHHTSIQGAGRSARCFSRPRPHQLRAGSDSCALP
jgi:DNA-binding GntR family transcriptional regulator